MEMPAQRTTQIGDQKSSLVDVIGVLEEKVKTLEARLTQVLRGQQAPANGKLSGRLEKDVDPSVELACFIRNQRRRITDIIDHVQNITDRCEL